jgi:propanol-preferring alcohol dehydrogenase
MPTVPERMLAAVLPQYKADLEIMELPVPRPRSGEVLLKVMGAGVCHSDLHLIDGEPAVFPQFPWTLGHEVAGEVVAVGDGTRGVETGELVAVFGGQGCGRCGNCISGLEQLCTAGTWTGTGVGRPGGYAEYMIVPAVRHLARLNGVDPAVGAALTDAGLTPYRAVRKALPALTANGTAVVIGLGALGQYAVQYLRMFSPARIIGLDVAADKCAVARELGVDVAVQAGLEDTTERLQGDAVLGQADVVLDFVGNDESLGLAARCVGPRGTLVIVGLGGGTIPVGFMTMAPEMTVTNVYWGTPAELVEVLGLAAAGRVQTRITTYPLADAQQAITDLRNGDVPGRAVLVP